MNIEEKYKYYDLLTNIALTNLFTLSKTNEEKKIVLTKFNKKDKGHLSLLKICGYATMFGAKIYIKTNPINAFFIKRKVKGANFKTTFSNKYNIDCNDFINYIEKAYDDPEVFKDIWDSYFCGKEEK